LLAYGTVSKMPRPATVIAYPDVVAIGALRVPFETGLAVPSDIRVIGFDDIPIAAFQCPSLTTVAVPTREMGAQAADVLMARIDGSRGARGPENIVLPVIVLQRTFR